MKISFMGSGSPILPDKRAVVTMPTDRRKKRSYGIYRNLLSEELVMLNKKAKQNLNSILFKK